MPDSTETNEPGVAGIGIGVPGTRGTALPELLTVLTDLAKFQSGVPVCTLLPAVEMLPQLLALILAAERCGQNQLTPDALIETLEKDQLVRVLPDEGIYKFAGREGGVFWLQSLTAKGGKFAVPRREAWRIQPTLLKRPFGEPNRHAWRAPVPLAWDEFAGCRLSNNTALARLAIVLIGTRTDFQGALNAIGLAAQAGDAVQTVGSGLPWGAVEDDGQVVLLHPNATCGEPVIAIAPDHASARKLAAHHASGSLIFISGRVDSALAERTSVELIAENHSFTLIAANRRREEVAEFRRHGWKIVELSGAGEGGSKTGMQSIDRIASISSSARNEPRFLMVECSEIEEAFSALNVFNTAAERFVDDDGVADCAALLRHVFFSACDWLGPVSSEGFAAVEANCRELKRLLPKVRMIAGAEASDAVTKLIHHVLELAARSKSDGVTPRGSALISAVTDAPDAGNEALVVVAGHSTSVSSIAAFLDAFGKARTCTTPKGLENGSDVCSVIGLSLLRREAFERFVDPWPAQYVSFLGFAHEVEIYRRRLSARRHLIVSLQPDSDLVRHVPKVMKFAPPVSDRSTDVLPSQHPTALLEPVELLPRRNPVVSPGDQTREARFCRFTGLSWMPVTDDHSIARVHGGIDGKMQVSTTAGRQLQAGDLILVREGGGRDVVRDIAEETLGNAQYAALRERAGYWLATLRGLGLEPRELQRELKAHEINRGTQAIRNWLMDEGPIGPNDPEKTFAAIAAIAGQQANDRRWKECLEAVHTVWRLHMRAGFQLTETLVAECGGSLLEFQENETPIELSVGRAWLLEVSQIETARRSWPHGQVNRIQWESDAWRRRLLQRLPSPQLRDLIIDF